MDKYFKKIQQAHEQVHMSDEEKDHLDDVVLSFVDAHPIVQPEPRRAVQSSWMLFHKKFAFAMAAVVLVLGGSVGTVLASEKSLPGEPLYTVKVNVAEEIRSALMFSAEERAAWEATRVDRRLSEIRKLLEDGSAIEKTVIDNVEGHLESHSNKVAQAAVSLQGQGDTEGLISIVDQLQVSLETYGDVLAELVQQDDGNIDPKVVALFASVEQTQQVAKAAQLDLILETESARDSHAILNGVEETGVRMTFPMRGDILVMGTSYDIRWDATVQDGAYVSLTVLDEKGNTMGYIGAVEYPAETMEWNPKYVLDISGGHQSKDMVPGFYRLRATIRDDRGTAHQAESELFEVIQPSIAAGKLHVKVLDGVGNPFERAYVQVNRTNQKQVQEAYTDEQGTVTFSLLPGSYTVAVSKDTNAIKEERTIHIAEVGETYISVSLLPRVVVPAALGDGKIFFE